MDIHEYFNTIEKTVRKNYEIANKAREIGIDPVSKVEIPIAMSLAEKAVGLISTIYPQLDRGVVDRILELEKQHGQLDNAVAFQIAEEIAKEKFCKFAGLLEAIDAGIRVGFSYITLGVVSSPIEGFTQIRINKTKNGEDYIVAYFSGPIRSAGTTAACMVLMLIDYLRECFGFAKYDPTEDEIRRYVTENYDYHERVTNLQYLPTEEEIVFLARNLPIQISGEPSEDREVSNYKNLPRIETDFIRGGMCLIFSEGLAQKAQKGLGLWRRLKEKGFKVTGWEFLDEYLTKYKKKSKGIRDNIPTYIKDLVAGRPVYSHPSRSGGFRFRYGRTRTSGFSANAVHPATMAISNSFLSFGTQLKIEKPTKGCVLGVTDEIDGPIVKLRNGSVKKLDDYDDALRVYKDVEEIIYLGDILVPFGDVANRFYELLKSGYVEEWWLLELKKAGCSEQVDKYHVSFEKAVEFSVKYGIPLHPEYIYYWNEIDKELFFGLLDWLSRGRVSNGKLILPFISYERERFKQGKRALELIGCEHIVSLENIVIEGNYTKSILSNLGIEIENGIEKEFDRINLIIKEAISNGKNILDAVNLISRFKIKDKSGAWIGARMGRPEKAKLRKLTGSPHVMFPVGEEGGRLRSFQAAVEQGYVNAEFSVYYCKKCKEEKIYPKCENCGEVCEKMMYCTECEKNYIGKCEEHNIGVSFRRKEIDIVHYFENAKKILGMQNGGAPAIIKGIRGTSNKEHNCEHLGKGFLRAKHNLNVNKDGTIRYDMTEMPITHFKPKEIGTSVEKLKELGYEYDFYGNKLEDKEQIVEIFPHDIILSSCPSSGDERADDVFFNVANFIDDELEKLYGAEKFFNAKNKEDIIGAYFACIAPHICTATVGRLIGFSKTQSLLASPYMHAAMRRDCDGDEAAVILFMDLLLNFSRKFLPAHRGGTQDAPLVLNIQIRAGDVDDQILDFESGPYSLDLYELAERGKHSSDVKSIETVRTRLKTGKDPLVGIPFTHDVKDFNYTVVNSSYKSLPTMGEKVEKMMELCSKLRAIEVSDVARLVIERHFIRDTRGNLRKFSQQGFRCTTCNSKYRRPPLQGKCTKCGGRLIFTISEGSILKYMQPALELARNFNVSPYLLENLELTEMFIESIFGKEKEKQESIKKWF
ncbi:DNA polymerase II large subunit [Candidatus Pacearchaeota archaeon]|nr:DNA polymerase II large subunit [Candidatus Pacearchaeota archaeon]